MGHGRRILGLSGVALALGIGVALAADGWEREFAGKIGSQDSNERYYAVKLVDPQSDKGRNALFNVLATQTWHIRGGAIEVLAGATGDAIPDLQKEMKSNKTPAVREGIVLAFGQMKSPDRVPDLIEALNDKDPVVRRAAVAGIVATPTKEGVGAIIAAWKREKQFDVAVFYKDALEKLTNNYFGHAIADWDGWWEAKKDKWKPPKPKKEKKPGEPEEPAEAAEEGEETGGEGKEKPEESTTTLRDVELSFKESGKGGPLFVLPFLGRNNKYMEKHLQSIEDNARLFYIDLPPISKFRGLKNVGNAGIPYYPLDMVVDAFDELRKERKQEQIAILGHEMAAWVAMRYATKYPKNVSHLILVSTWSSNKAWSDALQRVIKEGAAKKIQEQERYGKNRIRNQDTGKTEYEPKDPQEDEALSRYGWSLLWADPRNIFARDWFKITENPMGGCYTPEFDVGKEKGNPVPTMLMYGSKSIWTPAHDMKALNKYYPNSVVVECPNSADFPMIEDHELFTKAVKGFFKKHPFRKAKS
jgi:pimeloyl-ACP methyl ester carboxylesterase